MNLSEMRIVAIEDDESARHSLQLMLERNFPEIKLLGMADGVGSGIQLIRETQPNVLLLDLELTDGSGFDIADKFAEANIWIIFTTAHSKFSVTAFKYMSLSYLLKPIDPEEMARAFQKITHATSFSKDQLDETIKMVAQKRIDRIALPGLNEIRLVKLDEIVHCLSDKNYTEFFMLDGSKVTTSKTLMHYEKLLPKTDFMRIHKKHLINLSHLKAFLREDGGVALMTEGSKLEVSQRKKKELLSWMVDR